MAGIALRVPLETQVATQRFERVTVGQTEADQTSGGGHLVDRNDGAAEQNLRETEHREGERRLSGVGYRS